MEKMIIYLLIVIFLISFVLPFYISRKRKIKNEKILNRKSIMIDSLELNRLCFIPFLLLFIIVGLFIIYAAIKVGSNTNIVVGIIFGLFLIIIPLIIMINIMKDIIKVISGKYVIISDILADQRVIDDRYNERNLYQLYFKDYFTKYNKYVQVQSTEFHNSKVGDEFYLVFLKNCNTPYAFNKKNYTLDDKELDKIIDINSLKNFNSDIKEFILESPSLDNIEINKKKIIKDFFNKDQRKTVIVFILICIFLLIFLLSTIFVFGLNEITNWIALIISSLAFVFFCFLTFIKIKYVYTIIKNIKNNKYEIKNDIVKSINERVDFSDSNYMMSFRFENYKKLVYDSKKIFHDTKVGDEFYLVFVKGEEEPIKIYDSKRYFIGSDN